ncbi:MAG: PEP-CTERM sorting domain-containing protein [Planctomycetota bacterium]|jgi:hypothetical protein
MKNWAILCLLLAISSTAGAGTMLISGLPPMVDTSSGPTLLIFDIESNGQLDNDSLYVWTYDGATLDIALPGAINTVIPGSIYDNSPVQLLADDYGIDTTNVSSPIVWADIKLPKPVPAVIEGAIITDLGLTIPSGFAGTIDVKVLSENSGSVEDTFTIEAVPEPVTIALLGLGGLFLRRKK